MVNERPGIAPGQILAGKYRVERVLGEGGMGIVLAATHLALDQLVAIKLMLGAGKPGAVRRFVREARVTVRLKSPHVARIFDIAALDDGTPYIVMEHLEGKDLAELVREHGRLPIRAAVDAVLQAAEALAEAHALGIVHRDIKPANLFLARNPDDSACIKVLDFGIAKWARSGTQQLDLSGVMGSAPYMAPEQISAPDQVDARTDVWGLGATLFQLITGKTPFQHEGVATPHAMIHAILHRTPLSPRSLRPALPTEIEAVLQGCLEKDARARLQSMTALTHALAPFRSGGHPAAPHGNVPVPAVAPSQPSRPRGLVLGAGTTLLVGSTLAAATAWLVRTPPAPDPPAPHAPAAAAPAPDAPAPAPEIPASATRTEPPAPARTATSSPRILPPPPRHVSAAPSAPAPPATPPDTTRPKELYGERR